MREAAHRVLYTVVHSNAMNGITGGTRIITYTPSWVYVIEGFQIGIGVLFGLSVAGFIVTALLLNGDKLTKLGEKIKNLFNKNKRTGGEGQ